MICSSEPRSRLLDRLAWVAARIAGGGVDPGELRGALSPSFLENTTPLAVAESFDRCHAAIESFDVEHSVVLAPDRAVARLRDHRGIFWRLGVGVDCVTGTLYAVALQPCPTAAIKPRSWHDVPRLLAAFGVPAVSVSIRRSNGPTAVACWGVRRAGHPALVEPDDRFQLGSLSKVVCQLLLARLATSGALDLDADVNRYLHGWELRDATGRRVAVTLRKLLVHRGGVNVPGFPGYPYASGDHRHTTVLDVLRGVPPARTPPVCVAETPGGATRYSGGGYCVLQHSIEEALGAPYASIVAEQLTGPLGLPSLAFREPTDGVGTADGHLRDRPDCAGGWRYIEDAAASLWCTPRQMVELAETALGTTTRWPAGTGDASADLVVHTGATAGYMARLELAPRHGYMACVAANSGSAAPVVTAVANLAREHSFFHAKGF